MKAADLFQAVKSGDLDEVQRILKHNPNIEVDALDNSRFTPLIAAIRKNQKAITEVLLAPGAAVSKPVGVWRTPLQEACLKVNSPIVSLLL